MCKLDTIGNKDFGTATPGLRRGQATLRMPLY